MSLEPVRVTVSGYIGAPIQVPWALISDFSGVQRWNPEIVQCVSRETEAGLERTAYFPHFWATERLDEIDPARWSIRYSVTDSDNARIIGIRGRIDLEPSEDGGSRIHWTLHIADQGADEALLDFFKAYLTRRIGHLIDAVKGEGRDWRKPLQDLAEGG